MTLRDKRAETEPDATGQQELSLAQQRAIELLLLGYRDAEVAAAVWVTRQTVYNWRNHNEAFRDEMRGHLRQEPRPEKRDRGCICVGQSRGVGLDRRHLPRFLGCG